MQKIYKYYHHSMVSDDEWLWPNFTPAEMACKGTGALMIDIDAMNKLQHLRDLLGFPLVILSAYRSPQHNKNVGGAKKSKHLEACAFDVLMFGINPVIFEAAAREAGFTGFGFYPDTPFIHIDTGREREWGERWHDTIHRPTGLMQIDGDYSFTETLEGDEEPDDDAFNEADNFKTGDVKMNNQTKPWWQSKSVWGSLLAIGSQVIAFTGIDISPTDQLEISDAVVQIAGALGALYALYGRLVAKVKIS